MAEVSYLLTSYNKALSLPHVLESIRREQAVTGGHIIIVDDGSCDKSPELCRNFAETNLFATFIQQTCRGVYAALNRIIPLAQDPWIRLCDGDVPLVPGSTRHLVDMAEREGATIACGETVEGVVEACPFEASSIAPPLDFASFMYEDAILHLIQSRKLIPSQAIYRTDTAKATLPLPETLISCEGFALALRMTSTGKLVRMRAPVCCSINKAPNQLCMSHALTCLQTIRVLQASRTLLTPRHRKAAIATFYNWCRRDLNCQFNGIAFRRKNAFLKAIFAAAKFGFYDWNRALDAFAEPYEKQLSGALNHHVIPHTEVLP